MFVRPLGFGLLLCASLSSAFALIERTVVHSFPVSGKCRVRVDTFYGEIQVKSADAPEIKVRVKEAIDVKSEEAADKELRDLDLRIETASDGAVAVKAQTKRAVRWTWEKWPPVVLAVEISVPKTCDLDLISREGGIVVGNVQGEVTVRVVQGPVFIGEVEGSVTVQSEQGDVSVTACTGRLSLSARDGNVVVGRALGLTSVEAAQGAAEIQTAGGPLRAEVDGGDLRIGFAYPLLGDADIKAGGGDVVLSFDPRSAINVDARAASSGKVTFRDLAFQVRAGDFGSRRVEAELNGGGHRVVVRNSGGSVRILGVPAARDVR